MRQSTNLLSRAVKAIAKHKQKLPYIAFVILVLVWVIHFYFIMPDQGSYGLSFSSSLIEDIIFFSVFGITILLLQRIEPEENIFVRRVMSIANNKDVDDEAKQFLMTDIKKALAYTKRNDNIVTISEKSNDIIEVYVDTSATIINMCNDEPFPVKSGYSVTPGEKFGNYYGYIAFAGIEDDINPDNLEERKEILVPGPIRHLEENRTYSDKTNYFKISSDSSATSILRYAFYCKLNSDEKIVDNWNWSTVKRFTKEFNLSIKNATNKELNVRVYIARANSDGLDINNVLKHCESLKLPENGNKPVEIVNKIPLNPRDKVLYHVYSS